MKKLTVLSWLACVLMVGCLNDATPAAPTSALPLATSVPPTAEAVVSTEVPSSTSVVAAATTTPDSIQATDSHVPGTPLPPPFQGPLTLRQHESFRLVCDFNAPFDFDSEGFEPLSFVPTGDCQNGEIGLFEIGESTFIAQSGLFNAAFTLTDVTDPTVPQVIGVWDLEPEANVLDLKPFRQGDKHYLALGLQGNRQEPGMACGVQIVDVTNVRQPVLRTLLNGSVVDAPDNWCSVHTLEIDTDALGNATFIIVSDVDTFSAASCGYSRPRKPARD